MISCFYSTNCIYRPRCHLIYKYCHFVTYIYEYCNWHSCYIKQYVFSSLLTNLAWRHKNACDRQCVNLVLFKPWYTYVHLLMTVWVIKSTLVVHRKVKANVCVHSLKKWLCMSLLRPDSLANTNRLERNFSNAVKMKVTLNFCIFLPINKIMNSLLWRYKNVDIKPL